VVRRRGILVALLLLIALPVLFGGSVLGGDLLAYKPYSAPLEYSLNIKTHAMIDSGPEKSQGGIFRDHEDILTLSQNVKDAGDGLLGITATVKKINLLSHGPTFGAAYEREEITGGTQYIKINLQGKVKEAIVIPHFGSSQFWQRGDDGPPLDIYNILLMLNPRFPLGRPDVGSTWEVDDEIELGLADAISSVGRKTPLYELEMTVKHKIKYTLLGFENKKGYRCARIGFEAEFRTNGVMRDTDTGSYVEGNGKSSGELFFAPKEGVLVGASLKHHAIERLSKDGQILHFLSPKEMTFLYSDDPKSVPLPWRAVRTVTLKLVKGL
jgi:hypothetical protein